MLRTCIYSLRRHLLHDRKKERIERYQFEFARADHHPWPARTGEKLKRAKKAKSGPIVSDHTPEEYMAKVETVREVCAGRLLRSSPTPDLPRALLR